MIATTTLTDTLSNRIFRGVHDEWLADKEYHHSFSDYLRDKYYCEGYSQSLLYFKTEHDKLLFLMKI